MTEIKIQSDSFVSGFQRTSDLPGGSEVDGDYRGMAVSKQEDAADMLADAAEELTFSASETVEKKTTERKKKTDMPKVSALEAAEMMAQKLKDMNPQQLQKILQQIKDAGADGAKIRQLLKDNFKEPVMQHLALSFALGQSGDDPEMKEVLEQVQKDLETEHGPEIRAGYNINPVDSSTVGTPEQARALYRGTVLGHADIGDAFTDLYNQYGDEGFANAMEFLRKAIGADISAQTPSTSKTELEQSNRDLAHVQVLGNIHRDISTLLDKLAKNYGVNYP